MGSFEDDTIMYVNGNPLGKVISSMKFEFDPFPKEGAENQYGVTGTLSVTPNKKTMRKLKRFLRRASRKPPETIEITFDVKEEDRGNR